MRTKLLPILLFLVGFSTSIIAQEQDLSPWTGHPYGNEWIDYTKSYVRIGITEDGMYKIPLSTLAGKIPNLTSQNVAAWFRGEQIALYIDASDNVVFYGRRNDGVSDALLFRNTVSGGPDVNQTARLDKTTSFFSEEGSHFFSTAANPKRMNIVDGSTQGGSEPELFHINTITRNNSTWGSDDRRIGSYFGFSTATSSTASTNELNHSFYQKANAFIYRLAASGNGSIPSEFRQSVTLPGLFQGAGSFVELEYALHGNGDISHQATVSASTDNDGLFTPDKDVANHTFAKYDGLTNKKLLEINKHVSSSGNTFLGFKATGSGTGDVFGFSFYKFSYSQTPDMGSAQSKFFLFPGSAAGRRNITISNVPADTRVFDVSDPSSARLINNTNQNGATLTFDVVKNNASPLKLSLVANAGIRSVATARIYDVNRQLLQQSTNVSAFLTGSKINPEAFDYLIITHTDTERDIKGEAINYANYRSQLAGGGFRTLVISTRNIYDQFNYGEPSPVAIGRFVDYMISMGIRAKHNVFLIGHGVTLPPNMVKEFPYEVPSFGNPGSDGLLVANLSNSPFPNPNIPAVPIGRLTAFEAKHVRDYLEKVTYYEEESRTGSAAQLAWRRNVLHILGAKKNYELASEPANGQGFRAIFNRAASHMVNESPYNWNIALEANDAYAVSDEENSTLVAPAPIASHIESGVGSVIYFGHGHHELTQYNFATVPDSPNKRFPFFYITGCGVGNVFDARGTLYMATNWLIAKNQGAIGMLANSFKAYVGTAATYMEDLYKELYGVTDANRKTVGQLMQQMALISINKNPNGEYMICHINQTNVLGDPALHVMGLAPSTSLPVNLISFEGNYMENSGVFLKWATSRETNNDYFEIQRSADARKFETIATVKGQGNLEVDHKYSFVDGHPIPGINYYRLKQVDINTSGDNKETSTLSDIISVMVPGGDLFSLFPNPAHDLLNVTQNNRLKLSGWKMYSAAGTLIREGAEKSINIKNLTPGVYVLETTSDNGIITRTKFVKN